MITTSDDGGIKMKKLPDNMERVNARALRIINKLEGEGYVFHHNAWAGGYLPRNEWSVTAHWHESSKFSGIVVEVPSFSSSRYHKRIYFVRRA